MDSYSKEKGAEEHILDLGSGRQLAFAHNGPATSRIVILNFTGLMSVGSVPEVVESCREVGAHWIHPTLPGMGKSSPRAPGEEYHVALARDITALLDYLYPTGDFDTLYVGGGSYGTVQAQMIYGAPYSLFPAGRKIAGCLLLSGFSPFKYHVDHANSLTWHSWFTVGPPAHIIPFHILQRTFSTVLASKFKTIDGAKSFLNMSLFSKMDDDERKIFAQFLDKKGKTEDELISTMAKGIVRCGEQWSGFHEVSDVIYSDWGFEPSKLDDEHSSKPMLIVGSDKDPQGGSTNEWMGANYKSARVKTVPGGHISSMFYMDELWRELLELSGRSA
ncbi:uncharacterized protein DNG_03954 [Cephalotrichum gorgonifer]|uniref:AB hydrolase-1 domain-containing protein n=1 Tax=Cephalotrichum gorgonifer TaxID=2041049 RepID=A0AAE8MVN8_9PEZI|nr:uncharacterized protein DNG_03954 [Cephalotrichum gorgonifer]